MRLSAWAGVLVIVAPAVASCGDGSRACTDVGALSGVLFEFKAVLESHPERPLMVTACVKEACQRLRLAGRDKHHSILIGSGVVKDSTPLQVTLTISKIGATIYDGQTTVTPTEQRPNGPDCPPDTWWAQVYISGRNKLVQTVGPSD